MNWIKEKYPNRSAVVVVKETHGNEKMEKAKEIRQNYYSGGDNNDDCKKD